MTTLLGTLRSHLAAKRATIQKCGDPGDLGDLRLQTIKNADVFPDHLSFPEVIQGDQENMPGSPGSPGKFQGDPEKTQQNQQLITWITEITRKRDDTGSEEDNTSIEDRNLILGWQDHVAAFCPHTHAGEKLKSAALTFLCSRIAREAVTHGWDDLQLFGVMNSSSAAVIERRADLKGAVSFAALAPWPGTSVTSFQSLSADIGTAAGAKFRYIKRNLDPKLANPFWLAGAL